MRNLSLFILINSLVFLLLEAVIFHRFLQLTEDFENKQLAIYQAQVDFEEAIGYGGLIHHFKNYILRPDEEAYLQKARLSYDSAILQVKKIESIGAPIVDSAYLPLTREMLTYYKETLNVVTQKVSSGLSAREIDEIVRFDDRPALNEIKTLSENIHKTISEELQSKSKQTITLAILVFIFSVTVALVNIAFSLKHLKARAKKRLDAEQLKNTELQEINNSLQKFAGIVAHDLKAPVRHVTSFANLAIKDIDNETALKKHMDFILKSGEKMDSLIEGLLNFSKHGYQQPDKSYFYLQELIQEIVQDIQLTEEYSKAKITINKLPIAFADKELFRRVFHNLISNSLKYNNDPETATVIIDSIEKDDNYIIRVIDNGIGIDPKFAEKIFEPLARLHRDNSQFEGLGLGLFLVKSIIEAHEGVISLDTSYTDGTCFEISLPKDETSTKKETEEIEDEDD